MAEAQNVGVVCLRGWGGNGECGGCGGCGGGVGGRWHGMRLEKGGGIKEPFMSS